MVDCCPYCVDGKLGWNEIELSYKCVACGFDFPFDTDSKRPKDLIHGKNFLGSYIKKTQNESSDWEKLRILHHRIKKSEEWKRHIRMFESAVKRDEKKVLAYWNEMANPESSEIERGKMVLDMERELNVRTSVSCEVLERSGMWRRARYGVFDYRLLNRHGKVIEGIWEKYDGDSLVRGDEVLKLANLVGKISDRTNLSTWSVCALLTRTGRYAGSYWAMRSKKRAEEFGVVVGELYDSRKNEVRNNWTLCVVADSISKDLKRMLSPYDVLKTLSMQGRIKQTPLETFRTYNIYEHANLALTLIAEDGPKTIKQVSEDMEIGKRVSAYSLNLLQERKLVKVHKDMDGVFYFYKDGQEKQLRKMAPYLILEDFFLGSGRSFTTKDVMNAGNISYVKAHNFAERLVEEGKLTRTKNGRLCVYRPA